jgi:hypothetical protein
MLTDAGHEVVAVGPALTPLPSPDLATLRKRRLYDTAMVESVAHCERSLIRYAGSSGVDPALLIAQVALAWPGQSIVVVVKRVEEVRRLRKQLHKLVRGVVGLSGDDHPPFLEGVVVATIGYFLNGALSAKQRDILIVPNAREFAGQKRWYRTAYYENARLYGLLDVDAEPSPAEWDALRSLFGFTEVVVPAHGCRLRSVVPIEHRFRGLVQVPLQSAYDTKRSGIWQNLHRNRFVARLARNTTKGGGPLADAIAQACKVARPRVAVVVENLEHATALSTCLRHWSLVRAPNSWRGGLAVPRHLRRIAGQATSQQQRHSIVTFEGLRQLNISAYDVVVRADGGPGPLPIGLSQLTTSVHTPDRPLLLVDVVDRQHPLLRKWRRSRRDAYRSRDWYPLGVDPISERVRFFLDSRPREQVWSFIPLTDDARDWVAGLNVA